MTAGVEWLEQNGLESDLTLVFTDGDMGQITIGTIWASVTIWWSCSTASRTITIQRHIAESGVDTIVAQAA